MEELSLEMKKMRKFMEDWNQELNRKLSKYELVEIEPKGLIPKNTVEK